MRARQLGIPAGLSARRVLADRGGLAVAVLFYVLVVSVLAALWRLAADASGGDVVGYTGLALTWYVTTSEVAICAINQRLIEQIGDEIASGAVAVELLRPIPVVAVRLAAETGKALVRGAALIVPGVALAWVTAGPPPRADALVVAVPALVLAITANVSLQHAFAVMAFWIRDARSGWFLYQKVVFILGGMMLPLEVLPSTVHDVAMKLPFMAMAYVPARLASGHFEPGLLLVQAGWLAVLVVIAGAAFAVGQRRLQVVGG